MQRKRTLMVTFGTRPEAIKMAPIIREARQRDSFKVIAVCTGQHRSLMDQALESLEFGADHDLNVMKPNQTLFDTTEGVLRGLKGLQHDIQPDFVLAQGDTTSTFVAALAGFYHRIPVCHIEAGLRTNDRFNPYPEEVNRRLTSVVSDYHFCPTTKARDNLLAEGINESSIYVTGNTVIDALYAVLECNQTVDPIIDSICQTYERTILMTAHRRESFGEPLANILTAVRKLALKYKDVGFVYPVHPNPNVKHAAEKVLSAVDNVHLLEPLNYVSFAQLMQRCSFVMTDSGGVQEEAPALGKPVLVLRQTSERPEGIEAGSAILVGDTPEHIIEHASRLLDEQQVYDRMSQVRNPYGDGTAARQIISHLETL